MIAVKTTTNESAACDCEAVRKLIGEEVAQEGARAAEILGIRLAGVDVISRDVGVSLEKNEGAIIEVNVSPGLHYHYQVRNPEDSVPVAAYVLRSLLDIKK